MKIHPAPQGSDEWRAARLGLPTASNFHRIITPTGKPSASSTKYLADLLSEWFFEAQASDYESEFMVRGTEMEAEAVRWYEWESDRTTEAVGLCLTDDGKVGASPDRMVGADGCLELKCPAASTVLLYWAQGRPEGHVVQRQGQLWVCEREKSDLGIYHTVRELRTIIRDERDEPFIKTLAELVGAFVARLDEAKAKLANAKAEYDAARDERRKQREEEAGDVPASLIT